MSSFILMTLVGCVFVFLLFYSLLIHTIVPLPLKHRYLNVSQWDLDGAIRAASEDGEWEKASVHQPKSSGGASASTNELKSGDIHITLKVNQGVVESAIIRGSGHKRQVNNNTANDRDVVAAVAASSTSVKCPSKDDASVLSTTVNTSEDTASNAASVDDGDGVEVQSISSLVAPPGKK